MKQLALDVGLAVGSTLDNFIVGDNGAALSYIAALLEPAPPDAAPVYLWGASGTGKTHLLRAVAERLRARGAAVGWLDPTTTPDAPFDDAWGAVVFDDVHQFDDARQALAFNWFVNATTPARGAPRLLFAAGREPPADLPLREDLRSRLGWGQVFRLAGPSEATRRAVLRAQARERGIALPDEVLDYMLARFRRDLASLTQLLALLDRFALRAQRAVTIPLVRAMLDADIESESP